jgi:DNA-binding response OmpR family regulator
LLVDDEPAIRTLVAIVLRKRGYEVLMAEDGWHALDLYRRAKSPIELVILDVMMPGLTGPETLAQLLAFDPAAQVVFTSGAHAACLTRADRERTVGFLPKPFRLNELAEMIRALLDDIRSRPGRQPGP